ncbi:hypothetical protein COB57_06240 [Candidatus Peregrinibacteria bacterium]|nr:MAG: hypothetical protein COB57_06240 [Candidatus Peregrinibacteria bacterium]
MKHLRNIIAIFFALIVFIGFSAKLYDLHPNDIRYFSIAIPLYFIGYFIANKDNSFLGKAASILYHKNLKFIAMYGAMAFILFQFLTSLESISSITELTQFLSSKYDRLLSILLLVLGALISQNCIEKEYKNFFYSTVYSYYYYIFLAILLYDFNINFFTNQYISINIFTNQGMYKPIFFVLI